MKALGYVGGFDIIVIAASSGGVRAIGDVLAGLPADFPAAILVQMHLGTGKCYLREVLARRSTLPVKWALDQSILARQTVTLAPPGQHVRVAASGQLDLLSMDELNFKKPTADALFASVASSFGCRAIAVVLSGHLSDGAEGVRAIKQLGGIVLVQIPAAAEAAGMPSAAVATGCVDSVLPLSSIGAALAGLVQSGAAI